MSKLKLFTHAAASMLAAVGSADNSWTAGQAVGGGDYYLYNIGTKTFLNAGDPDEGWGTHAFMNSRFGYKITLSANEEAWNIATPCSNGGTSNYLTSSCWSDGAATGWTFTPVTVDGYTNVYTISVNSTYLTAASTKKVTTEKAVASDNDSYWILISKDQLKDNFKNASEANPVDATFFLKNPEFQRNFDGGSSAWTWTKSDGNHIVITNSNYTPINNASYYGCEFWNNTFDIHQTVSDLPVGKYKLSIQGFGVNGTTYLYATADGTTTSQTFASTSSENINQYNAAIAAVNGGSYTTTTTDAFSVKGGTLTVGVKRETNQSRDWTVFDNMYLEYVGALSSEEAITAYNDALTAANEANAKTDTMAATAKEALTAALTTYGSLNTSTATSDELQKATSALTEAVTAVNTSIAAYSSAATALKARNELYRNNNFITDEAYKAYYTDLLTNFEARTLTTDEAKAINNPYTISKWHADSITNKYMGSAYGITDYNGAVPYVNTWSKEGESDGSNFKVPFYEYWVADGSILEDKTLTTTKTGLTAGKVYKVTAWVRARLSNYQTAPVTGITMDAGGSSVAITGTQVGSSQLYLDNYTVYGTADSEGTLTVNFKVAGTNASWLSFQNLKYEEATVTALDESASNTISEASDAYVTLKRSFVNGYHNTLVLPFDLTADQVKAAFGSDAKVYSFANTEGDQVNFTEATTISANVPVLITTKTTATEFTFTNVDVKRATPTATGTNWNFVGTYNAKTAVPANSYEMYNNALYKSDGTNSYFVNGFRAYLEPNTTAAAKPMLNIGGTATSINKVISGIDKEGNLYNLAGQRVSKNTKGLLIKNGKKFINK